MLRCSGYKTVRLEAIRELSTQRPTQRHVRRSMAERPRRIDGVFSVTTRSSQPVNCGRTGIVSMSLLGWHGMLDKKDAHASDHTSLHLT